MGTLFEVNKDEGSVVEVYKTVPPNIISVTLNSDQDDWNPTGLQDAGLIRITIKKGDYAPPFIRVIVFYFFLLLNFGFSTTVSFSNFGSSTTGSSTFSSIPREILILFLISL